jgi:hypothetical protein
VKRLVGPTFLSAINRQAGMLGPQKETGRFSGRDLAREAFNRRLQPAAQRAVSRAGLRHTQKNLFRTPFAGTAEKAFSSKNG